MPKQEPGRFLVRACVTMDTDTGGRDSGTGGLRRRRLLADLQQRPAGRRAERFPDQLTARKTANFVRSRYKTGVDVAMSKTGRRLQLRQEPPADGF